MSATDEALAKTYDPAAIEQTHYARWEAAGRFNSDVNSQAEPFVVMMPPPNVTGSLHMGHALNHTIQDILVRYYRMQGRDALWQPGTDHAGIATQMVVERRLAEEQQPGRREMGREAFVEKVWEWKAESGGTIVNQLRRLGTSPDWRNERFTMDDRYSDAVLKVFVELYREGLIYRDKRLVNWDPQLLTAISDLEVQNIEMQGKMWHFRYPLEDDPSRHIVVATTRPETMLGDSGVAVHPDDERYKDLIGKHVILPIVGRRIPIVADDYADPELGSGAVKITPAHDFNDFEVGRRNGLEEINVFDEHARLNENAPEAYRGLDRFEARDKVVAEMESLGLLEKVEDHVLQVPHGDRSSAVIEPWLTDQWFVDAKTLAQEPLAAVRDGRTRFVPKNWERTYFEWLENIQPWCISRQLWWGHQIPAWYGPDGHFFVAESEREAHAEAAEHYGRDVELVRDEDVLDTWFSSALWPFATIGWPDETPELERYYPGSVLVTGFDIIFFWVARMMMMGLHFMKEVPFHDVYIHALVRDEHGQKMSKSKGNIIDPLELIDEYGADALRFTLAALAAQGRDIKLSVNRVEGYRNFATKLWNAARFCEMNECRPDPDFNPAQVKLALNRWIVGGVAQLGLEVARSIEEYRFNEGATALYQFIWGTFCDWYVEFSKPILNGEDEAARAETRATAAWALGRMLHYLHPFMPFVSEELWTRFGGTAETPLISAEWPVLPETLIDGQVAAEMDWVVELITRIRSVRAEMNVPPAAQVPLVWREIDAASRESLQRHDELIRRLARLDSVAEAGGELPKGSAQIVLGDAVFALPLAEVIDIDQERQRLEKEIGKIDDEIGKLEKKLANENFIAKAPPAVVEEQRERRDQAQSRRGKLEEALGRLA